MPDIYLHVHEDEIARRGRARGPPPTADHSNLAVVGVGAINGDIDLPSPILLEVRRRSPPAPRGWGPRIVVRRGALRIGPYRTSARSPLRIGRGEQRCHRPALGVAEQGCPLGSRRHPSPPGHRPSASRGRAARRGRSESPVPRLSKRISRRRSRVDRGNGVTGVLPVRAPGRRTNPGTRTRSSDPRR